MKPSIRLAHKADAPVISALSTQHGYNISISETKLLLDIINEDEGELVYVAILNNRIVGWIQASKTIRLESGISYEVVGLVVDEKYRKKGIATLLIEKVKFLAQKQGGEKLRVRCNILRIDSIEFYLKRGFKQKKEQKVLDMHFS